MAVEYPTLSTKMSWQSTITRTPKIEVLAFGDGATQRYGIGNNNLPGVFVAVHPNMNQADFVTLRNFVLAHAGTGEAIHIQTLPEDPTGNTWGYYRITSYSITGDFAPTVTVNMEEVFTDA